MWKLLGYWRILKQGCKKREIERDIEGIREIEGNRERDGE